jgi:phenylacetate-CoA ligase
MPMTGRVRERVYTGLQGLLGSRVGARLEEFLRLEKSTPDVLPDLQRERIDRLLRFAVQYVPYYRARCGNDDRLRLEDLPVLTKTEVRDHFRELMSPEVSAGYKGRRREGYSWIEVKTGGSTGQPTTVIHDARLRDYGRAARLYSQRLCGFPFGTPYFRLWGSMKEISQMRESAACRLTRLLAGERLLNAFRMSEPRMREYLALMARSRVRHMMAYVDCAAELARFARENGIPVRPLDSLMACAGTVTPASRALIEGVFGCKLHNKYGSRDCTEMACECRDGRMHVYSNHVLLEVVDEQGRAVRPGTAGRLLVTLLNNYSFPMIRYEIGDVGALGEGSCPCGSPFPILDRVEGRTSELLKTSSGTYVSPLFIMHLVGVVHNPGFVRRFQLVQREPAQFDLNLELAGDTQDGQLETLGGRLEHDLAAVFGETCSVRARRVDAIPASPSGKFLYVVSHVRG